MRNLCRMLVVLSQVFFLAGCGGSKSKGAGPVKSAEELKASCSKFMKEVAEPQALLGPLRDAAKAGRSVSFIQFVVAVEGDRSPEPQYPDEIYYEKTGLRDPSDLRRVLSADTTSEAELYASFCKEMKMKVDNGDPFHSLHLVDASVDRVVYRRDFKSEALPDSNGKVTVTGFLEIILSVLDSGRGYQDTQYRSSHNIVLKGKFPGQDREENATLKGSEGHIRRRIVTDKLPETVEVNASVLQLFPPGLAAPASTLEKAAGKLPSDRIKISVAELKVLQNALGRATPSQLTIKK
ncbi:MAG: hypothetical protein AB7G93_22970 [Bdellovibrionales bacterium]